jgi:uncharacterized damage-inducible protein DinB
MEILNKQYELIRSSRGVVLDFIEQEVGSGYLTPVAEFNNKDIRYFLLHINNTYKYWLANFAMRKGLTYADYKGDYNLAQIRGLFEETDKLVPEFLQRFENMDEQVTNEVNTGGLLTTTALALFTHATTHEFHHKGQVMTICRMLGHTPPDTDVIRT